VRAIFTSYTVIAPLSHRQHSRRLGGLRTGKPCSASFRGARGTHSSGCGADQNPQPRGTGGARYRGMGKRSPREAKRLVERKLAPIHGKLDCRAKQIELAYDRLPAPTSSGSPCRIGKPPPSHIMQRKTSPGSIAARVFPSHLPYLVQTWTFGNDLAHGLPAGRDRGGLLAAHQTRVRPQRLW